CPTRGSASTTRNVVSSSLGAPSASGSSTRRLRSAPARRRGCGGSSSLGAPSARDPGRRLMDLWHNVRRFFGSLRPGPPPAADREWAETHLLAGEVPLWRAMSNPDQRHAVRVARRVEAALGPDAPRPVMAAALLHDVGKN